jgi:hypothetical protein
MKAIVQETYGSAFGQECTLMAPFSVAALSRPRSRAAGGYASAGRRQRRSSGGALHVDASGAPSWWACYRVRGGGVVAWTGGSVAGAGLGCG